ncbi:TRAP transporter large permease [Desulfofustis glycolicus]|uniref:TRAP transporter, DctM subunit n=1 Tax=Desulfofustis glycolicus DSM 9705 TaxID=1121409 RepID=A0A1M5YEF5_9BACT|nr:TRAP transporter large permease [Desulfofustis glycolicus]MCB2216903.1 TRAP transporter large permease [Desulfobulbaceae bacterium]SHI10332.1 TRAP transporter, DctM subunit [Desulfofustis glycolicus DSM 9705]
MLILLGSLLCFLLVGVPIAYSLGLSGLAYFWMVHPELLSVLPARFFAGMNSYAMIAMPLFVFMGLLMNSGGITTRLIDFSLMFVGRLRGGLGLVNVIASMVFGGISGSSVSDTASVGAVLIPEMKKKGYSLEFASGITVASSTMGMIIPPSVPMVIYAYISEESVGRLFLGGLIPGVLIGLLMLVITVIVSYYKKFPTAATTLSNRDRLVLTGRAFPALIMPVFVVGAVVLGLATATESAGLGVLYAFFVGLFLLKELELKAVPKLLRDSIQTSATVMIIIALSKLYVWILALERIPQSLALFVSGLDVPVFAILAVVLVIILLVGTFVDVSPAILLLTPVFLPAMKLLGINGIQFGVILITGLAMGLVTPPVGMCLNVCSAISKVQIGRIFKAALPFLLANLITLILITYIPHLSLWLPSLLMD